MAVSHSTMRALREDVCHTARLSIAVKGVVMAVSHSTLRALREDVLQQGNALHTAVQHTIREIDLTVSHSTMRTVHQNMLP